MKIRQVVFGSLYLALFTVLNVISAYVAFLQMPNGGSIEIGVIALFLASYHFGAKFGVLISLLSVLMQYLTQGLAAPIYIIGLNQFLLDYVLAFGSFGLASIFKNYRIFKFDFFSGVVITYILRFISSSLAGYLYWGLPIAGSMLYNFGYNFVTMMIALLIVPSLYQKINLLTKLD